MDATNQENTPIDSNSEDNQLNATKKRALEALVALLPQLDSLEPEQKYRICIDAVRFTDNKSLVDAALDTALKIGDLETQANALLEVVAEINYLQESR